MDIIYELRAKIDLLDRRLNEIDEKIQEEKLKFQRLTLAIHNEIHGVPGGVRRPGGKHLLAEQTSDKVKFPGRSDGGGAN